MFGEVWRWAGEFSRERRRAIGFDGPDIAPALQMLCDDAAYWIAHDSFAPDMIAVRFHQRLTQIHPFPNGNGRHARLMTDLLLRRLGRPDFTWGADDLHASGEARRAYVAALRQADAGEFDGLLAVARR